MMNWSNGQGWWWKRWNNAGEISPYREFAERDLSTGDSPVRGCGDSLVRGCGDSLGGIMPVKFHLTGNSRSEIYQRVIPLFVAVVIPLFVAVVILQYLPL